MGFRNQSGGRHQPLTTTLPWRPPAAFAGMLPTAGDLDCSAAPLDSLVAGRWELPGAKPEVSRALPLRPLASSQMRRAAPLRTEVPAPAKQTLPTATASPDVVVPVRRPVVQVQREHAGRGAVVPVTAAERRSRPTAAKRLRPPTDYGLSNSERRLSRTGYDSSCFVTAPVWSPHLM